MATLQDIGVSAGFNLLSAFVFLLAFALLRIQPFNDRVYFPKWYIRGLRNNPMQTGAFVGKIVNLDFKSYLKFLNWMPDALKMPEAELIEHAGLDSAVYLRIYIVGLRENAFHPNMQEVELNENANMLKDFCDVEFTTTMMLVYGGDPYNGNPKYGVKFKRDPEFLINRLFQCVLED